MTVHEQVEIELKFDVDAGQPIPDLTTLPGVATTTGPIVEQLDATYFDTENLDLADHAVTLRRRTGGHDEGWHLKRPGTERGRTERQVPLDAAGDDAHAVPAELIEPVRVHLRSRSVSPVAAIGTRRQITEARDSEGTLLAVLCADLVTARSLLPGGTGQVWSEWEFELVADFDDDAAVELLESAEALLRAAGARTASSGSKLARAIGSTPGHRENRRLPAKPTALELVVTELARHRDQLVAWDPAVRADADDAVHQMRVATRRLRSVLKAFPGVLDGPEPERLGEEFKELAAILGVARDAEVQAERYRDLLEDENPSAALESALVEAQNQRYHRGRKAAVAAMTSDRYFRLLDAIDALLVDPTPGENAQVPARAALRDAVRSSRKSVLKAQKKLSRYDEGTPEWTEQLHVVRKKAKRLRYVAEAGATLRGSLHSDEARTAKRIQAALGDANDASISREVLAVAAGSIGVDPTDAFVLGRLDAREQAEHDRALKRYSDVAGDL
ncbi:CYTH and CHAD domain-containing protein [Williamsia phyllosphaerae]|uniref:CHAD domain-containing protein n=1 Tax=Williamsia phyllosphaerae TaxID=885042 RepID=A0ABQ1UX44_9NOCA|nr:CYTH and CHAD domain-containing protein [Williamsia phyllosphaerae]GGF28987.1 CHAD domain-containing protein [Williamsia phyllosphaerae]